MNPEQLRSFRRQVLPFVLVGSVTGGAVLVYVWMIMEDMRSSVHQAVLATGDLQKIASFEAWLQYERHASMVGLGLAWLVSTCFAIGLVYLLLQLKRRFSA